MRSIYSLSFFSMMCIAVSVGVGDNHIVLHLSMLYKALDKICISRSALWLQVCASDLRSLSSLSDT